MSTLVPSQRSTTSSRTPGRVNVGTVWTVKAQLVACADCRRLTTDLVTPGEHGAHFDGFGVLVNCVGREVQR